MHGVQGCKTRWCDSHAPQPRTCSMSAQCRMRSMLCVPSRMLAVSSAVTTVSSVSPSTSGRFTSPLAPPKSGLLNLAAKKRLSAASTSALQATCMCRRVDVHADR